MSRLTMQPLWALILAATLAVNTAASGTAIGVAIAQGSFQLDNAKVSGNGTIFDGASVQTAESPSRINLNNGTRVALGPESKGKVTAARLLLEKGVSELQAAEKFEIEARSLHIQPGPRSIARVLLESGKKVRVEAVEGPVNVFNRSGKLIAKVTPGVALSFEPQAAQEDSFQMQGCLLRKEGRFVLVDQTTNQIVEVRGEGVTQHVCNRVRVTGNAISGATPVAGASMVVQVRTIAQTEVAGCLAAATQISADPCRMAAGPAIRGGKAGGKHTGAIIAGVAVAAGAGIGAAVALSGKGKSSTSP